jgi:hypothetical protein
VDTLKAAMVAPARLLAVPNLTIPLILNVWGCPARSCGVHHDIVR